MSPFYIRQAIPTPKALNERQIMVFYSHWLDLVGKLVSTLIVVTLLIKTDVIEMIRPTLNQTPNPEFFVVAAIGIFVIGYYLAFHHPVVDVVVTMVYVRHSFDISISWDQAKLLRRLFCINLRTMQWNPMRQVRSIPVEQRLQILVAAAHG